MGFGDYYDHMNYAHSFYWPSLIGMLLFWAVVIVILVMVFRYWSRHVGANAPRPSHGGAEQILHERFARGEIDEDEYAKRLGALRTIGLQSPKK